MTRIDYVTRGEFEALKREIRALGTQSPLESSAVKNGRVRFIGGTLRVEAGGSVEIVGTLEIDGSTTVTGTFTVDGPWSINGDGAITGQVTISGPVTISGDVDLTGDMDVTGDINVTGSGRVNVGTAMRLNPATDGGAVEFNTGVLRSTGVALGLYFTGGGSLVLNTGASLVGPGCSFVAGATPRITGMPTRTRANANNAVIGTVWTDGSDLYRVVA